MKKILFLLFLILSLPACEKKSDDVFIRESVEDLVHSLKNNDVSSFKSLFATSAEVKNWISSWDNKDLVKSNLEQFGRDVDQGVYSDGHYKEMFYKLRQDPIMLYRDSAFWSKAILKKISKEKISKTSNYAFKTKVVMRFSYQGDEIKLLIEPYKEAINNRWYLVSAPRWMNYEKKMMERIMEDY